MEAGVVQKQGEHMVLCVLHWMSTYTDVFTRLSVCTVHMSIKFGLKFRSCTPLTFTLNWNPQNPPSHPIRYQRNWYWKSGLWCHAAVRYSISLNQGGCWFTWRSRRRHRWWLLPGLHSASSPPSKLWPGLQGPSLTTDIQTQINKDTQGAHTKADIEKVRQN